MSALSLPARALARAPALARRRAGAVLPVLATGVLTACPAPEPKPALVDDLPFQLMVRSDSPYVGGRVHERQVLSDSAVRIRVRGTMALATTEAIVTVRAGTLVLWRGGRAARLEDLGVGRTVVVWTRDHAPTGSPPAVVADAVLVDDR